MTRRLLVSARAEADLREIWRWSYQQFGEAQADRYLDELDDGLRECGARPEEGVSRDLLRIGYRSRSIGKHLVFYTFTDDQVLIQRILHSRMDHWVHLPSTGTGN